MILGGVDEHFNLPIHLAMERGDFEKAGVQVQWKTFAGGTGQMTRALQNGEADVCILLTEGVIAAINAGLQARIVAAFTDSPLIWGVHTASDSRVDQYDDIFDKHYAISRWGSGSHLIAMVDAQTKGKPLRRDQLIVTGNLEGARLSLRTKETEVFYWEKFTTKPYVDRGELRRVGEFLTPWPAWMIAASNRFTDAEPLALQTVLSVIRKSAASLMKDPNAASLVAHRYDLSPEDAAAWFRTVRWSETGKVPPGLIEIVNKALTAGDIS